LELENSTPATIPSALAFFDWHSYSFIFCREPGLERERRFSPRNFAIQPKVE
jgi:hypothetical protein